MEAGKLYICATPIGNMEDITLRVLRTLKEVDYIAAEDTRYTLKLLNHYGISKPLVSYHQHNQQKAANISLNCWSRGMILQWYRIRGCRAYPIRGAQLVVLARDKGIPVTIVPGPTACVSALVLSRYGCRPFCVRRISSKIKESQ